ncbi:exo-alpha-sialidase, partial [candidate division WOR-3 bacterium]|nr:exo-alpha-sialidase [candidate division WOR-3 bacterium]
HSEDETFATRDIYYNVWEKASGSFPDYWPDGVKASGVPRAGYTTMGALPDGRAVIAFHHTPTTDNVSAVVVDASPKLGAFSSPVDVDPVTVPEQPIWPHIVVGADDVIHVTAHVFGEGNPYNVNYLYYSRSTDQGQTFSPWQVLAQNAGSDAAIATSKDGSKVAVAWLSGVPVQGYPDKIASSGHINYIESTNSGVSWGSPVRITDGYYPDEAPNTTDEFYLYAWSRDLDCAYDAAGNLHIGFGEGPRSYEVRSDTLWFSYYYPYFLRMMHWSEVTNELNVASGPYSQFVPLTEEGDTVWDLYGLYLWGIAQSAGYWSPGLGCWNPQLAAIGSG